MNNYQYKDLTLEVTSEPTYKFGSADNPFNYSKYHFGDGVTEYPTSKHGIKIYQDEQIIDSCIIFGSDGATEMFIKIHHFLTTTNYCPVVATQYFV